MIYESLLNYACLSAFKLTKVGVITLFLVFSKQ